MQEEIVIGKTKYPLARCTKITNGRECTTAHNPAFTMCTHCRHRAIYMAKKCGKINTCL